MFCFLTGSWNLQAHPKGESFASNPICQMISLFLSEHFYHFEAQWASKAQHNPKELHWSALRPLCIHQSSWSQKTVLPLPAPLSSSKRIAPFTEAHFAYCLHQSALGPPIFLVYKEIQKGSIAKSYMTNGLLING